MELLTFGETTEININEAYQDVLFAGEQVGFIHYKAKSLLAPLEEYFWSDLLTKEQAKAVSSRSTRIDDAEDSGYKQAFQRSRADYQQENSFQGGPKRVEVVL